MTVLSDSSAKPSEHRISQSSQQNQNARNMKSPETKTQGLRSWQGHQK